MTNFSELRVFLCMTPTSKSIEGLIPWLYLKGVSTGGFGEALQSLLGTESPGLSASTTTRLKRAWEAEYGDWNRRSLEGQEYVYLWADGVHFNLRLGEDGPCCILVLLGVTPAGKKELIATHDGFSESEQSWKELLLDVKSRGLIVDPKLATGDGALGFWKALPQVYPTTRQQRCWVQTCSTSCPSVRRPEPRRRFIRSGWPIPARMPAKRSTCS